jgi:hypothetical protein
MLSELVLACPPVVGQEAMCIIFLVFSGFDLSEDFDVVCRSSVLTSVIHCDVYISTSLAVEGIALGIVKEKVPACWRVECLNRVFVTNVHLYGEWE